MKGLSNTSENPTHPRNSTWSKPPNSITLALSGGSLPLETNVGESIVDLDNALKCIFMTYLFGHYLLFIMLNLYN